MSKMIDLTDRRFGKLYVVKRVENFYSETSNFQDTQWLCRCDCGNELVVRKAALIYHGKSHCGCVKKYMPIKHGMSHTRIHNIWLGMKDRCLNSNSESYQNYGERGIKICSEWLGDSGFENFYKWAMENGYSDELTIDRKDVNGNYDPSNCQWATHEEQNNNTRKTIHVTYNGETLSLAQMCEKYGVKYHTAYDRYMKGMPIEKVLFNKPWQSEISGNRRKVAKIDKDTNEILETYNSAADAARKNGIKSRNNILSASNGKSKHAGGYIWKYVDE